MNATLNAEDNEMIPRTLTGDLRKPQLEWLMLRKILQVKPEGAVGGNVGGGHSALKRPINE